MEKFFSLVCFVRAADVDYVIELFIEGEGNWRNVSYAIIFNILYFSLKVLGEEGSSNKSSSAAVLAASSSRIGPHGSV